MTKLGDKVKDFITGFEGTVTGISEYLYGCRQLLVCSHTLEGGDVKALWFDEQRMNPVSDAGPGGPQSTPPVRHP